MVAGVIFVATSGAETIDPIIDPIAAEIARKRGWKWGSKTAAAGTQAPPGGGVDTAGNPLAESPQ